jgi:hypothetical protein
MLAQERNVDVVHDLVSSLEGELTCLRDHLHEVETENPRRGDQTCELEKGVQSIQSMIVADGNDSEERPDLSSSHIGDVVSSLREESTRLADHLQAVETDNTRPDDDL